MKVLLSLSALTLLCSFALGAPKTFRVDFYHTGNDHQELCSLDRLVLEPLEWAGNPAQAIDESNLGDYLFEVRDRATNRLLYSRGYSSIYAEWVETAEAKSITRSFQESLRFPAPAAPVQVILKKRDVSSGFHELWSLVVDPADPTIDPALPASPGPLIELLKNGEPSTKVDLLILGDGYTAAERGKFEKDARRLLETLFATSPFKERKSDFNVWGLCPAAAASGVSRPSTGVHLRSPVGATYDSFGSERYLLTFDNHALRDIASYAPYEFVEILTNSKTYGGGGIFNLFATVAADNLYAPYVFVHEFGHHFAGLGDEYFTSDSPYQPDSSLPEPWQPNTTAQTDPKKIKWKSLLSADVAMPTPWPKEAYEKQSKDYQKKRASLRAEKKPEEEMEELFKYEQEVETKLFTADPNFGKVGAFEGANYLSKGYYRPQMDCIMFSRNSVPFCAVCREAISRVIDANSTPTAATR